MIQQIVAGSNRLVNEANPIVDARLPDGSRVNVVLAPVALNGPIVTIRKFPREAITMKDLLAWQSVSPEVVGFLARLVRAGYNIFISGGTGSGKTTFLNALSQYIPKDERIITIEDNAELRILDVPNLVSLEARNANVEGSGEVTIRDLIRSALRMRPDRIIVGEVRGAEAIDMLQALNTGHDGSLSTGHANSPADMLSRLETMVLMGMESTLAGHPAADRLRDRRDRPSGPSAGQDQEGIGSGGGQGLPGGRDPACAAVQLRGDRGERWEDSGNLEKRSGACPPGEATGSRRSGSVSGPRHL